MELKLIPRKLEGVVRAQPSKSHAHRLLIASKLAEIQSHSGRGFSQGLTPSGNEADVAWISGEGSELSMDSDDINATRACLAQLDKVNPYMECGESGSTLRFLLPLVMALKDSATFLGQGRLPDRPISPLKEEMERHGCSFIMGSNKNTDRFKEICQVSGRMQAGEYVLPGNVSSQFITGLLFALPVLDGDSWITLNTELESAGYIDMTLDVLSRFGIDIAVEKNQEGFLTYGIPGNQIYVKPEDISIDADWSNAAFWLAAGALSGNITVCGLDLNSCQWDKEILDVLAMMGADLDIVTHENGRSDITSKACNLKGVELDVSQIPDLAPVLAVLMAFAEGTSMISHGERLRLKESNRMKTIYASLLALDADISYGGDRLSFTGKAFLEGGHADSYGDHRIAMATAIASCLCRQPVYLENPSAISKSYPAFYGDFVSLGGEIEEVVE